MTQCAFAKRHPRPLLRFQKDHCADPPGRRRAAARKRAAVSVDARSAALAALPESVARLKARGVDCRVLFLEANPQTLMRRFSETRRRHPRSDGRLTLTECIER